MNLTSNFSEDFPKGKKIYLNNASVSLTPIVSIKAMTDFLVTYNQIGPDSQESDIFIKNKLMQVRKAISKLVKCEPEEIILTQSTTDGINIVANGISNSSKSNIITRGNGHEHHANLFPWLRLSNKFEIRSLKVDENGFFEIDQMRKIIDNNTGLVALSHGLYNTGSILSVEEIGEILEQKNIPYFLDTAQTMGCIGDFNFQKTKCNFMSFNGSKWLCGPMGTGIFYCRKDSSNLLEPHSIGGESAMIYDKTKLAYREIPDKFQTGFRNYVGFVGLEASIMYLLRFGLQNIRNKVISLSDLLRNELSKIKGLTLFGPVDREKRNSIISFTIEGKNPQVVVEQLEKQNIVLAVREINDKKIIRASPHLFNTESEIFRVVDSIKNL